MPNLFVILVYLYICCFLHASHSLKFSLCFFPTLQSVISIDSCLGIPTFFSTNSLFQHAFILQFDPYIFSVATKPTWLFHIDCSLLHSVHIHLLLIPCWPSLFLLYSIFFNKSPISATYKLLFCFSLYTHSYFLTNGASWSIDSVVIGNYRSLNRHRI